MMQKFTPTPSLLLVFLLLTLFGQAQPAPTKITVYTGNFTGMKEDLAVGRYTNIYLAQSGISFVGSISVPAGMKVTIYANDNYSGHALTVTEDATTRYLKANGFADIGMQVSLIVEALAPGELPVKPPFITVYENNFSGASKNLAEGRYDAHDFGHIANDRISSVKVPKGMKVTLYEHAGYAGRTLVLTKDATADFLIKNKFNDVTSSVLVEREEVEEVKPVIVVAPVKKDSVINTPVIEQTNDIVTIFQGDFSGISKILMPGKYTLANLGIGNDELSSISIRPGHRVTLFADDNFKGKSITLTDGLNTAGLTQRDFNNITSSLIVEEIPKVRIFEGNLNSSSATLLPGKYDLDVLLDYNIMDNEVSAVKVPEGYRVILFDLEGFKGRALMLTEDAPTEFLISKNFNNITSSLTVEELEKPVETDTRLMATIYDLNFNGRSQTLPAGKYEYQDLVIGNNAVSSITVPYGLRVTLYEYGAQEGRSMTITKDAGSELLEQHHFNDITTSLVVEVRPEDELYVTLFADTYSGNSQKLKPGKYRAEDLLIGSKQLTSLRVPRGLMATLFENRNFTGLSLTVDRDTDFSTSKMFNNLYASVIVEDMHEPVVTPIPTVVTQPEPVVVADTIVLTGTIETNAPDCALTEKEYYTALKAVESKPFSGEKMQTARIATEGKCLTNEQIRGLAQTFSFEDQTLEFVLYTYDLASEKSTFYMLEDVFKFMSSKEKFNAFLKEKK